jgi:para-nitrobenzyl esterase
MSSILSVLFLTLCLSIIPPSASIDVPTIQTTSGKLRGISVSNSTNAYLGVPYAVPPTGRLRFLAPRSLSTPQIARNATSFGPACIQPPTQEISSGQSEDCLSLNVWTSRTNPGRDSRPKSKPVFIWLYGGAWTTGTTSWECKYTVHVACHLYNENPQCII